MRYFSIGIILTICMSGVLFAAAESSCIVEQDKGVIMHPSTDVYDGWRLGVQTWSFNRFTLFDAIEKARSLGLSWIQAYPGQPISPDNKTGFGPEMSEELRKSVKDKLRAESVRIFAFGVTGIPTDESQAQKLFEFAKEMGIETIVTEPEFDQFDAIDKLCQKYQIKIAIHNHPKPSRYWDPQTVLKMCEGRSAWIGACADVGHWARSGLNPVECLAKLQGRIHDVHIKEVDIPEPKEGEWGKDVVWGQGQGRIEGVLKELHRQGYTGTFSIEYEDAWDNNVPLIRQSIAYFNSVASSLKPSGWTNLFATDLSNADFKAESWTLQEDVLELVGGSDIWTKEKYGDFILDFDFKVQNHTNSGVFLRAGNQDWLPWAEVQIADSFGQDLSKHICGAIFDIQAPAVNAVLPPGQWNRMTIKAEGAKITVLLNNRSIVDINLDRWDKAGQNPNGTENKFKDIAYKDLPRKGILGFQDHRDGTKVYYRNIKIKKF